jgi:hypothetical protein
VENLKTQKEKEMSHSIGIKYVTAALAGLAFVATLAGSSSAAVCSRTIRLKATPAGLAIRADGRARVRSDARGRQSLVVEITAFVPDGTVLSVSANGVLAGTAAVMFNRAVLDLNNAANPLPAGLDPVCGITQVLVADPAGTVILTGMF